MWASRSLLTRCSLKKQQTNKQKSSNTNNSILPLLWLEEIHQQLKFSVKESLLSNNNSSQMPSSYNFCLQYYYVKIKQKIIVITTVANIDTLYLLGRLNLIEGGPQLCEVITN